MLANSPDPWWRVHRSGLRRAAIVACALYLLYLVAANVFLNSAFGDGVINRKPERFHARWDWAMSLYPGHIHARGIVMGGHARTNLWTIASPRANGRIRILPLLGREITFGRIRAQNVSVHVARTPHDLPTTVRPGKSPWTIRFAAITTPSLLRLDFYDARVTGHGEARFEFEKTLQGGAMEVGPSTLTMPDATLQISDVTVLREGMLEFEIAIPAHIREQAQGEEKLVLLDAHMRVDGPAPGIDLVARNDDALPIGTSGFVGHLRADLTLERGVLMPGSQLDWSAPVYSSAADGTPLRHPLGVALRTSSDAILVAARVPAPASGTPWLRADLRVADRRIGPDDWLRPVRALGGTVETQWPAVPLRWIDVILRDVDWLAFDGRADLDADVRLHEGQLQPGSRIDLDHAALTARVLDNRFSGNAHARMRMRDDAQAGQRTTIGIVLDRFTLAPESAPDRIDLRGRDLRLDLSSTGALAEFHERLDARLRFDDAQVPDLRTYNRYLPGDSARLVGGSGHASGDIRLDNGGEMIGGRMRVRGQDVRVALGPSQLSGNVDLDSRLSRMQRVGRRYKIDAMALRLDGVRLDGSGGDDAPWWAKLALENGTLDWREPFEVTGRGRVDMRDVSVLLGLFAERSVFPRWIGNLIDSGEAHATGDLRLRGNELVFDRVQASNDRIDMQARLRIADGTPNGDLYARWGVLGMGVELQGGDRKLHIAGARDWYESRPPLLPE
ncbi:hypothetical protein LU699_05085 [Luteimonas fraxinea]|uniref:Autotransporter secretion inner membrane protein TamB n=1 Tax=Luteimonas fraxinea TaxID=2901869 RepID=A0ABS8U7W1_9GAMM|nr:hypothetical protein [Luteimonas fraxinea]MCD9095715.1 hypothetical protein [Luteimonas fraxinea]UHH11097.1 hypothetical protein LU699_05085 [Luteimonas fraxinea]